MLLACAGSEAEDAFLREAPKDVIPALSCRRYFGALKECGHGIARQGPASLQSADE